MSNKLLPFVGLMIAAVAGTACSSIRVVQMGPAGGEIALFGDMEGAMEKAQKEMALTCGGPRRYQVVQQGEVVVGEVTTAQQKTRPVRGPFGSRGRVTSQRVVTQPVREWHVYYQCIDSAQSGVAAAPVGESAATTHQLRFQL